MQLYETINGEVKVRLLKDHQPNQATVSYTHLDVYKRQGKRSGEGLHQRQSGADGRAGRSAEGKDEPDS